MSATAIQILIATIGVAGSTVAAFFGSWFGLRRFRQERIWEEKLHAYQALFDALNDLGEQFDQLWNARVTGRQLPQEKAELLRQAAIKAWSQIRKQARIGSLILSDQANAILTRLLDQAGKAEKAADYDEYIDHQGGAVDEALRALKDAAQADLRAYAPRRRVIM